MLTKYLIAVAMLTALVACSVTPSGEACESRPDLAGWVHRMLAENSVIAFGEFHGTKEAPRVSEEMVCAALNTHSKIIVGLELPESAIEDVRLALSNGAASALPEGEYWPKAHDGRTSVAMYDLLKTLIGFESAGRIDLVGFDIRTTGREAFGPLAGERIRNAISAAGRSTSKALLLTGRGHVGFNNLDRSIAEYLTGKDISTLSVDLVSSGGEGWVCRVGSCGVQSAPDDICDAERGTVATVMGEIDSTRREASYCLGVVSASPPKVL